MLDSFFFWAFATLVLGGALFTVTLRNPVHCAISLIVSLCGVAGIFLLEGAEFLFASQIIAYVGGVVTLTDSAVSIPSTPKRFYRLRVTRP